MSPRSKLAFRQRRPVYWRAAERGWEQARVWQIIGLILLPFAWMALAGMNKAHKEQTGVSMPTRSALKAMRRRARKKGVSEQEYYAGWVERKQKKAGIRAGTAASSAAILKPAKKTPSSKRHRAPAHEPFTFEHLSMMGKRSVDPLVSG